MITLQTDTAAYYLLDDGMVYDALDSILPIESLDVFLNSHNVTSITSEDGYKFTVTADCVTNGDMTFNNLESAIEVLQA